MLGRTVHLIGKISALNEEVHVKHTLHHYRIPSKPQLHFITSHPPTHFVNGHSRCVFVPHGVRYGQHRTVPH